MDELAGWLKLAHTPGIGLRKQQTLLSHFGSPDRLIASGTKALARCGLSPAQLEALCGNPDAGMIALLNEVQDWLAHPLNHVIHRGHSLYPAALNEISDPPTLLYVTGDPESLITPTVAIVGSRKSSPAGLSIAGRLATGLSGYGLSIGSGMALGIDQAAHHAALDAGGLTIAVMGTGLKKVYPARHRELAYAISESGALVSELPLNAGPLAFHFPRRNRIISGLATGVVIIEAALKSGSLTTANHARDQGREVMVVPGSINNPLSRGCNALIREGATLVESAEDIVTEIAAQIDTDPRLRSRSAPSGSSEKVENNNISCILLNLMGFDPITIDSLVTLSGQGIHTVTIRLSQLELEGRIASLSGGRYVRC